jgi:class III poly(R)-hydroxyalkanoic acid synthase PhaE subunit
MIDETRTGPDQAEAWRAATDGFHRAWTEWVARMAGMGGTGAATPWAEALSAARARQGDSSTAAGQIWIDHFAAQALDALRSFEQLSAMVSKVCTAGAGDAGARLDHCFESLAREFGEQMTAAWSAAWGASPEHESGSGAPPPSASASALWDRLQRLTPLPAIGPARERLEAAREGARLILQCETAAQAYLTALREIAAAAFEALRRRLAGMAGDHARDGALMRLHEVWLECAEGAYAERVMTDDYARRFGELLNSTMRLRKHFQKLEADAFAQRNLPSRPEIDALHARVRQLQERLDALQRSAPPVAPGAAATPVETTVARPAESARGEKSAPAPPRRRARRAASHKRSSGDSTASTAARWDVAGLGRRERAGHPPSPDAEVDTR